MHTREQKERRPDMDDGEAFLPDPREGARVRSRDDLAELVAEDFVASATSGEEQGEDMRDQVVAEELGGPFLQSLATEELVDDVDAANPEGAEAEPFPRAIGGR